MEGRTATRPATPTWHSCGVFGAMEAPSLERTLTGSTGASAETEARLQGLVRDLFHLADVDANGAIQFLGQHGTGDLGGREQHGTPERFEIEIKGLLKSSHFTIYPNPDPIKP